MNKQPPQSFIIAFANDTYNRGCGFEVGINEATLYPTREEADRVASQLRGATVYELPAKPHDRVKSVGPRWITAQHPRPSEGSLATLKVVLNDLRAEAVNNHKLEGDTTWPATARQTFTLNRYAKEAHANVVLDVLKYFGVDGLPTHLDLPLYEVSK